LAAAADKIPDKGGLESRRGELVRFQVATSPKEQTGLFHPRAAALDQDDQHNDKEHAGGNPD
jgi:hypothetical protein